MARNLLIRFSAIFVALAVTLSLSVPSFAGAVQCRDIFNGPAVRAPQTIQSLRLMTYNASELYLPVGKLAALSPGQFEAVLGSYPKPLAQVQGLAEMVRRGKPDLLVMQEVGGIEALNEFSKTYLNNEYKPYLINGNSSRGGDVCFLVKRDLPLSFALESHSDMTRFNPLINQVSRIFTRDVPALIIRRQGAAATEKPLMIVLGHHGKSKRDRDGDPESRMARTAESVGIGKIIDGYRKQFGNDVPITLVGDFNTNFRQAAESVEIMKRLVDAFDIVKAPAASRATHMTYRPDVGPVVSQLDGILVDRSVGGWVTSARVLPYLDNQGRPKPVPQTLSERDQNASDHQPVVVELSTKAIFPEAFQTQRASGF